MEATTIKLYSLDYSNSRTYFTGVLFIIGNLIFPQLCHLIPLGGIIFLPIYFFTLVGAYKYGWKVGLLTGIFSVLINSLFFGMPLPEVLPTILIKSVLLAFAAGIAANYFKRISIPVLLLVVLSYQLVGTAVEWLIVGDFHAAVQDFRMGIPGMLLQVIGGFLFVKYLIRK